MAFRLLAITDPGCAVSTRYRVSQYHPYLHQYQIHLETRPWPKLAAEQSSLLEAVGEADAVLFQRYLPSRRWLRKIHQRARRLVYDFDDAIIYAESTRGRPRLLLNRWWRFRAMMRCCAVVTAGNPYLAKLAQREAPTGRVRVVPTTLNLERYRDDRAPRENVSVVGWIGGRWTLPYLEQLRRPLEELSDVVPGLAFHVIADQAGQLGRTRVEWVPWAEETEVVELKRLRVGVAPLPDDRWTQGKCGLRLLQYLAAGIPAVASPVGTQAEIISAGAALPASSGSEWTRALHRVLADEALASDLIARGRQLVREHFDTSQWAERVRELWCGTCERREHANPAA